MPGKIPGSLLPFFTKQPRGGIPTGCEKEERFREDEGKNTMIRRCCICRNIYGEKAPFSEPSETTGVCDACYLPYLEEIEKQLKEYHEWERQGRTRRP